MTAFKVLLPAMGEGIVDATITKWLISEGQNVEVDQSLVEIATDKVDSEIPSPVKGVVKQLLFKEGEAPRVGQTIAIIETEEKLGEQVEPAKQEAPKKVIEVPQKVSVLEKSKVEDSSINAPYISPLVRKIVQEEGIRNDELLKIKGTGLNNRITKDDILEFIAIREKKLEAAKFAPVQDIKPSIPASNQSDGVMFEVIKMDRMRRLIAEHMVMSKQTSPHVTSFIEADVTNLMLFRDKIKDPYLKKEGEKLTLTPFFIEAAVQGIKKHPLINSSVEGDSIILKKNINIGIATSLPNGNLIVPVIKNADQLNLTGISKSLNSIAKRARENQLKPDEIQGGTFTITNLGMFDTLTGTPIINQPQVAILAVGTIVKRVVVIESESGDSIGIRQMMMLSLSYDHRVVDGALAGSYLKTVRDYIQKFDPKNGII
jgi:2-oxoglutarate dehydrogenase E2 component (dihydrolipoamide succinyltransferase)